MSLLRYLGRAAALPPQVVVRRGAQVLRRETGRRALRLRDRLLPTYGARRWPPGTPLHRIVAAPPPEALRGRAAEIAALAELHLAHRFDLLGSGWTEVAHGAPCAGLEGRRYAAPPPPPDPARLLNRANRREGARLRGLIDRAYRPIDWQLDFKSGYRWSERSWYRCVPYGHLPGVDVKVPWELARMQHLPLLAHAASLARLGVPGLRPAGEYAAELRNEILDFIAANPPRHGVAWACTMDVAIRAANWLVAFDLFRSAGEAFDAPFADALLASLEDHGRFIAANLEWGVELRANHYLADVAGLLFVAAWLPRSPRADAWLAFAVHELAAETALQFNADGGSFEGSTSYHRLAAEMALYATAVVLGLPEGKRAALREYDHGLAPAVPGVPPAPLPEHPLPGGRGSSPFAPEHFRRLELMAEFTLRLTDEAGLVPQVGDNDSGRFLKLWPALRRTTAREARERYANLEGWAGFPDGADYWDEEAGDHRHLLAAAAGLLDRADFAAAAGEAHPETAIVRALAGGVSLPARGPREGAPPPGAAASGGGAWPGSPRPGERALERRLEFPGDDLREGLRLAAWPDFGLWLYRSRRLYLAVRCGPVGQRGNGGHAHNDQLSLVLRVDGRAVVDDPGTYLYTPLPERRNAYRSARAHAGPRAADGREPGRLDRGLFTLGDEARARCLHFGPEGFLGTHRGFGVPVHRRIEILPEAIVVTDWGGAGLELLEPLAAGGVPHSPGYGKRVRG